MPTRRFERGVGQMRLAVGLILALHVMGPVGCGRTVAPQSPENAQRARATLNRALDAWKSGQLPSLTAESPPIRLGDDDALAGLELTDYQWEKPDAPIGPFQDVKVVLSLRDGQGRDFRRTVTYQVGLEPTLTVLRSDN